MKAVDLLIVVTKDSEWKPSGGTWYTHDYARKIGKDTIVIWPDGKIQEGPCP